MKICDALGETNIRSPLKMAAMMPKHIAIPYMPIDSELTFEFLLFMYTSMALGLQYLNLYRTVWWLPHSYTQYALNVHLIDFDLTLFILVIHSRRLMWGLVKKIIKYASPSMGKNYFLQICRWAAVVTMALTLATLIWRIVKANSVFTAVYLCYPITLYCFLFGRNADALLELVPAPPQRKCKAVSKQRSHPQLSLCSTGTEIHHACSLSAEVIRDEVNHLKSDVGSRMKIVFFNSLLGAYYVGFVPCCFGQSTVQYDVYFSTQHLCFVWVGCFLMCLLQLYPPQYCDVLHCSARHLGTWYKVSQSASQNGTCSIWSDTVLWPHGAYVRHTKELFKGDGIVIAAEPGNITHHRFYVLFKNPALLWQGVLGLQLIIIVFQTTQLAWSQEWYQIISLALLTVSNYYCLFKLVRDYRVQNNLYKAEDLFQNRISD